MPRLSLPKANQLLEAAFVLERSTSGHVHSCLILTPHVYAPLVLGNEIRKTLVWALRKTSLVLTLTAWKLSLEIKNLALNLLRLRGDLDNVLPISQKCLQARVTASTLRIFQRNVSLLAPWKTEEKPFSSGEAGSCWPSSQPRVRNLHVTVIPDLPIQTIFPHDHSGQGHHDGLPQNPNWGRPTPNGSCLPFSSLAHFFACMHDCWKITFQFLDRMPPDIWQGTNSPWTRVQKDLFIHTEVPNTYPVPGLGICLLNLDTKHCCPVR